MKFSKAHGFEMQEKAVVDEAFNFSLLRMQGAIAGGSIKIPHGLSRAERRKWIFENKGKCSEQ